MSETDTLPVWEKIYQIVSGSNEHVTREIIDDTLDLCQLKLINVLLDFKPYTKESFEEWKKFISISDDEMCSFIHRLSKDLDLDVNIAWLVTCNFLVFCYYGKVDELKSIIKYEANVKSFIDHVWYYYSGDRMFLLKTLRFIFEKLKDKHHQFYSKFYSFVGAIDLQELWTNLVTTFITLTREVTLVKSHRVYEDTLPRWVHRNNREQSEVLLLMIHLLDLIPLTGQELTDLLTLFVRHGFGRHALFLGAESFTRQKDFEDIKSAELGVILTIIRRYWGNQNFCRMIPKQLETDLEHNQMKDDDGCVLLIWVVFKAAISDEYLEYCTIALEALMVKKVFKSFSDIITSNMYRNCTVGEIVLEGVNKLFLELMKICTDYKLIYEQEGAVKIICELFKRPHLKALENLPKFFEVGLEMFPFVLNNFLDMVEALITVKEHYHKVFKILRNCPSYCTELYWPYPSDKVYADEAKSLFLGTDRFIIPQGTLSERCNCYGMDMLKFNYKYDYFKVIEQYMRSLTMWVVNRREYNKFILDCVLRAFRFLSFLIKHYRGNFENDNVIRPILRKLDCIPTYYNEGDFRHYEFFYAYFELQCTSFIYQDINFEEVFPLIVRKAMFPYVTDYSTARFELRYEHGINDSILYSFLKEEEGSKDHKLLLIYTEVILAVVKRKVLYKEVLYGGVWYLINDVFITLRRWDYDEAEPFQQLKILNVCLKVFTEVLQENYEDIANDEDARELYKLVQDFFLKEDFIVNCLASLFVKDKFYLQNSLNQESNWISGETLVVIEAIKVELGLLMALFKCRARIPKERCFIDSRTTIFAKAACFYFVNPYNCTLAVLAGKCMEVLAKDDNIPLMSCLGLDHDQIQTLFLERLRDPMEDDDVKCNVLDLISTCLLHQTGLTAAFFNIQAKKKWYDTDRRKVERDTVPNFMIDYLDNIEKSVAYLQCPLQVGILRIMTILWQCDKQHLVKEVSSLPRFWRLLCMPLYKEFDQKPLVYYYILKIVCIHCRVMLRKKETDVRFIEATENFFLHLKRLKLFKNYLFKIFSKPELPKHALEDRKMLIETLTELLAIIGNQDIITNFPTIETKYMYIELCFDRIQTPVVHKNILSIWLDFTLVIIDIFGLKFTEKYDELTRYAINFAKIISLYYQGLKVEDKTTALTIIVEIIRDLKPRYDKCPHDLSLLLDEIGALIDFEYEELEEKVWKMLKANVENAATALVPWTLFISIANIILQLENCRYYTVWFTNRKYLDKMVKCTCDLLSYKQSLPSGKLALYSLTLYAQSPLAFDFFKVNMVYFYDRIEPMVNKLLTGQFSKMNALDLKEAWLIFSLLLKFNQSFLKNFRKYALEVCFSFLTLNEHILKHIVTIPENTVDLKALDLLLQTIIFYDDILSEWGLEWYRRSNKTFSLMIDGVTKVINSCIYLFLRPKHIVFYYLDEYHKLLPEENPETINCLMVAVVNRLMGILGLAFGCLYKLNLNLIHLFGNYYELEEAPTILIKNDFSVPRFDLPSPCELTYGKLLCLINFLCKTLSLVRGEDAYSISIDEAHVRKYIGLIEHRNPSEDIPDQKLNSIVRWFAEDTGSSVDPWINKLNPRNVMITADALMLFVAQQAFLTMKALEPRPIIHFKRNLYSELQVFNEFVKKQTSECLELNLILHKPVNIHKMDMDQIKRYLLIAWEQKRQDKVVDENFLLIISFWFTHVCRLPNLLN